MMRRFERMMATPTTKIRLACMRASNESSSMPPPFRAASPHPPLYAFTLHLFFFAIFSLPNIISLRSLYRPVSRTFTFLVIFLRLSCILLRLPQIFEKEYWESLGQRVFDTEIVSSRILVHDRCKYTTVNSKELIIHRIARLFFLFQIFI